MGTVTMLGLMRSKGLQSGYPRSAPDFPDSFPLMRNLRRSAISYCRCPLDIFMRAARRATLSPLPQIYGNLVQETGGGNTLSLTASHFIDILHLESPGLSVKGPAWFLLHKTFFHGDGI